MRSIFVHLLSVVMVSLVVLLLTVSPATADCRFIRAAPVRVVYDTPTVVVEKKNVILERTTIVEKEIPVAVPVATFSYVQSLAPLNPVPAYNVYPNLHPYQQPYQQPYPQQAAAPQKCLSAEDVERIVQQRLTAAFGQRDGEPPPLRQGSSGQAPSDNSPAWVSALGKNCFECHNDSSARGGVRLFTNAGVFSPNVDDKKIGDSIQSGRMPKDKMLSADDKSTILARFPVR